MPRTTLDIDAPILAEVKALGKRDGRPVGKVVTELLADALELRRKTRAEPRLSWVSRPMGALVDVNDKEALYAALDQPES
jgi:hypothetical protein